MRKKIIWTMILLLIGVNILLVWFDKEGKVERKAHVSEWEAAYEEDLFVRIEAPGVISNSGESYVYFDDNIGSFQGFLMEEGSEVAVGDPLFSYRVNDYVEAEAQLVNELSKINGEITAIEDAITEMVAYNIPRPSVPVVNMDEEEDSELPPPREPIEADLLKKQYLVEKEKELASYKEQKNSVETQLEELQSNGDTITVESPFEGKVTSISTTLDDPIMVIENTQLYVQGELTEVDRKKVEEGMSVSIKIVDSDQQFQGTIQEVDESPKEEVTIESESLYPFGVMFDEADELNSLLPGYHTELTITLDEALNATAINQEMLDQQHVWLLTEEGKLEKRPIETGIEMEGTVEVINGITSGDFLSTEKKPSVYTDSTFITPLKFSQTPWLELGDYESWKKYLLIGIISR
ncbi:HlyD family efflux transporter periplasmic adaptor subunit [Ornithinibacillus sp. L9]|uniref:HlyD family efflux transporter periplasmic adaptor subunit n=1 Tax=Ornithinibacillus caprae TaxID=2678566 RepID=A0A6N8FS43_9BACI|nr:efflux RND transporter periplasmic adaptor subunit [Ornithinibacillus caprae]MUK90788.1 HlyD family efflux transporter periplasmic adaptor subunit [Ornithinibacillus caprae]